MTYKEETYILDSIKQLKESVKQIRAETHENNIMLRQICKVINVYLRNHNQENVDDFGRNVLANVFSNLFDFNKLFR